MFQHVSFISFDSLRVSIVLGVALGLHLWQGRQERILKCSLREGVDVPMMVADGCFVYHLYSSRKVKESNLESTSDVCF